MLKLSSAEAGLCSGSSCGGDRQQDWGTAQAAGWRDTGSRPSVWHWCVRHPPGRQAPKLQGMLTKLLHHCARFAHSQKGTTRRRYLLITIEIAISCLHLCQAGTVQALARLAAGMQGLELRKGAGCKVKSLRAGIRPGSSSLNVVRGRDPSREHALLDTLLICFGLLAPSAKLRRTTLSCRRGDGKKSPYLCLKTVFLELRSRSCQKGPDILLSGLPFAGTVPRSL